MPTPHFSRCAQSKLTSTLGSPRCRSSIQPMATTAVPSSLGHAKDLCSTPLFVVMDRLRATHLFVQLGKGLVEPVDGPLDLTRIVARKLDVRLAVWALEVHSGPQFREGHGKRGLASWAREICGEVCHGALLLQRGMFCQDGERSASPQTGQGLGATPPVLEPELATPESADRAPQAVTSRRLRRNLGDPSRFSISPVARRCDLARGCTCGGRRVRGTLVLRSLVAEPIATA